MTIDTFIEYLSGLTEPKTLDDTLEPVRFTFKGVEFVVTFSVRTLIYYEWAVSFNGAKPLLVMPAIAYLKWIKHFGFKCKSVTTWRTIDYRPHKWTYHLKDINFNIIEFFKRYEAGEFYKITKHNK